MSGIIYLIAVERLLISKNSFIL